MEQHCSDQDRLCADEPGKRTPRASAAGVAVGGQGDDAQNMEDHGGEADRPAYPARPGPRLDSAAEADTCPGARWAGPVLRCAEAGPDCAGRGQQGAQARGCPPLLLCPRNNPPPPLRTPPPGPQLPRLHPPRPDGHGVLPCSHNCRLCTPQHRPRTRKDGKPRVCPPLTRSCPIRSLGRKPRSRPSCRICCQGRT